MYFSSSIFIAAAVGIAQAQKGATPSGFTPAASNQLDVIFNSTKVEKPGQLLSKAQTASQPRLALSSDEVSSDDTYVFVMLDLDVPGQGNNATRRVLLHAMNTGFKATSQSVDGGAVLLASSDKGPATYIGPGPPATDTIAHRYTQLLFKQPDSLEVSATEFSDTKARIGFDITSFAKENGLGEPVAGNFFMVDGRATAESGTGNGTAGAGGPKETGSGGGKEGGSGGAKESGSGGAKESGAGGAKESGAGGAKESGAKESGAKETGAGGAKETGAGSGSGSAKETGGGGRRGNSTATMGAGGAKETGGGGRRGNSTGPDMFEGGASAVELPWSIAGLMSLGGLALLAL